MPIQIIRSGAGISANLSEAVYEAQEENFAVKEIAVEMTENYEIKCIHMTLTNPVKEGIVIGKVVLEDGQKKQASEDGAYKKLKEKLVSYYQLSEEQLDILYE